MPESDEPSGSNIFYSYASGRKNITSLTITIKYAKNADLISRIYSFVRSLLDLTYVGETDSLILDFTLPATNSPSDEYIMAVMDKRVMRQVPSDRCAF